MGQGNSREMQAFDIENSTDATSRTNKTDLGFGIGTIALVFVGLVGLGVGLGWAWGISSAAPMISELPAEAIPWPPAKFKGYLASSTAGETQAWIQTVAGMEDWEKGLSLGDLSFETSAKSERAKAHFTLGLLCLHNFLYVMATEQFQKAQRAEREADSDRDYPMAIWGEVMSTKLMLWMESDCITGKTILKKLKPVAEYPWLLPTELAMMPTALTLYASDIECSADTEHARELRVEASLAKATEAQPDNTEAALFHVLAKMAVLSHPECEDPASTTRCMTELAAAREALRLQHEKFPRHPGALHYITHAYDLPDIFQVASANFIDMKETPAETHAAKVGIKASYDFLKLTRSSCHALHMPSHIFMRTGNWAMSALSNAASIDACDELATTRKLDYTYEAGNLYHSLEYLHNDFLQLGRYKDADQLVARVDQAVDAQLERNAALGDKEAWKLAQTYIWWQYRMHARNMLETYTYHRIPHPFGGTLPQSAIADSMTDGDITNGVLAEGGALVGLGLSAVKFRRQVMDAKNPHPVVQACLRRLDALSAAIDQRAGVMAYVKQAVRMWKQELQGVHLLSMSVYPKSINCLAENDCTPDPAQLKLALDALEGATQIQRDSMLELSITPTVLFLPSFEILGNAYLLLGKDYISKAQQAFEESIKKRMGRTHSLLGLARAHAKQNHMDQATYFYKYIVDQLQYADSGNPFLLEAQEFLSGQRDKVVREWPYPR